MRRRTNTSIARMTGLVTALIAGGIPGLAHAQPVGLPWASFAGGGAGLTPFYVMGFELGPWQEYLAHELTPEYMLDPDSGPVRVSWLEDDMVLIMPAFTDEWNQSTDYILELGFDWQSSSELQFPGFVPGTEPPLTTLDRQIFESALLHDLGGGDVVGVAAVMAYQSYGVSRLGLRTGDPTMQWDPNDQWYDPYHESGYGLGVRLGFTSEVAEGLAFDAGFQSRIDMEEFGVYRGVYSQPADLDIPARASVGLAFQSTEKSWVNFSVERVLYSDINAFPSTYLPDRFLSLLGDSTSPEFAWDDLTVFTVGWRWSNGENTEWRLDYSTRSQPEATSSVLNSALAGELADNALILGFSRRTGERSRLDLNAAYAPAEYAFGGSVLGVTTESLDQDIEFEAMWIIDF